MSDGCDAASSNRAISRRGSKLAERGIDLVSQLYDLKLRIDAKIKADGLDEIAVKGKIGLRSGKVLAFITEKTPDDPVVVGKLKEAAKEILNLTF
jgi:hypothetical protein